MARYKDLDKDPTPYTDGIGYTLEQSVKGSAEPAIIERREEKPLEFLISDELTILRDGLIEVKKDLNHIKELIDKMERNGLKMKANW